MAKTKYFFAYGSAMHVPTLKTWLVQRGARPDSILSACRATLKGYKVVFNHISLQSGAGEANLEPHAKSTVEGVLMQIDLTAESHLDQRMGVPRLARKLEVSVADEQDKTFDNVYTYVAIKAEPGKFYPPKKRTLELIQKAAEEFALSESYRNSLTSVKTAD